MTPERDASFVAFAQAVRARLDVGEREYGGASFGRAAESPDGASLSQVAPLQGACPTPRGGASPDLADALAP
jgi:hypothetical protein